MTPDDSKQLAAELCKRWKGKLTREDLAYWARELDDHGIPEIVEALTKFRNSSRFVPKVSEIKKLLPRRVDAPTEAVNEGSFADVLRRPSGSRFKGQSDAEVYLRYWRSVWYTYKPGADQRIVAMRQAAEQVNTPEVRARLGVFESQYAGMKEKCRSGCAGNLTMIPVDRKEAERLADRIFDPPDFFRMVLAEIRQQPSKADVEAVEEVFA